MLKIGEKIKELRKAQDVTQEKLADYLNISYQAVSKWENGLALPDITLLPQLANFFGVTADELLGVTKPEQSEELTQYEKQYFKFGREGKVLEKIALCRKVLKKYPRNYQWMLNLAYGLVFDWAGEFRTIQMVKYEDVLGGDTVRYAYPKEIKKQLNETMKEIAKPKRTGDNDKDIVFKLVRIIASIWQTHPFREGNTRTVIVFAVLLAKSLGFEVEHELFKTNSAYVRNALVWASQGMICQKCQIRIILLGNLIREIIRNLKLYPDLP